MSIKKQEQQSLITTVKKSETFKNAPTSIALLQYLFEATSNDIRLKESIIDIDFFGNTKFSEKSSTRVRVNVYNLRKKIVQYYEKEGKDDLWKIAIDKGQYQVRFYKKDNTNRFTKTVFLKRFLPYFGLVILSVLFVISNLKPSTPKVWKSFLSDKTSTNFFIGDHFGLTGKTITNSLGWTRDFSINNQKDFESFSKNNPNLKLKPSTYSYTTKMAALSSQKLQQFYQNYDKNFDIRFSTESSISDIKEEFAIYAGPTKNKNPFIYFFNKANPYCKIKNDSLFIKNYQNFYSSEININSKNTSEEFAIVSKYLNDNKTEHFVFFSQHDIGVTATLEYFTNVDSLKAFQKKYLQDEKYFTVIFKVKGIDRTSIDLKLIDVISF